MIIRRPYAFLIKHFKIIHIILLVIGGFILLKNSSISSYIKDFVTYGVYDSMNNPITKYIPIYLFIILIAMSVLNITAVFLLKYKDKPWKLYLIPTITYLGLMILYALLLLYFNGYNGVFERTQIGLYKDLLNIFTITQLPSLIIYLVRCLGLDLKKFNFQNDDEFLELDEKDRMELEINVNVDKESIKRVFRRFKRNAGYFVEEHKKLVTVVSIIVVVAIGLVIYKNQFITNKSYGINDEYNAGRYTFKITNVYYTNKNYTGEVISNSSAFVIVKLNIRNNYDDAVVKVDRFHLYNGIEQYAESSNQNADKFIDLGKTYAQQTILKKGETTSVILIYRVNKKLDKNRFVLFYQERNGNDSHLRKIKIKVEDLSTIKDNGIYKLGTEIKAPVVGREEGEMLAPDGFKIRDAVKYMMADCENGYCEQVEQILRAKAGYKIAVISYMTEEFDSKELIDFSSNYGKINYIDSNNKKCGVKMKKAMNYSYLGQYAYVFVPEEIEQSKTIDLVYTIRNNRYTYRVKG